MNKIPKKEINGKMNSINQDSLIGLTEAEAVQKLKDFGAKFRIRSRDGRAFMGTCDFVQTRFNLVIEGDKIVSVRMG